MTCNVWHITDISTEPAKGNFVLGFHDIISELVLMCTVNVLVLAKANKSRKS